MRIDTVLASNTGKAFDPALASLRQPFVGLFPYSSYRLVQGEQRRVAWRREAEFLLPGGRYLVVIPRGYKDGRVLLNVMLIAGTRPLVNTALALKNHGVFLVAGPHYEEGMLIIAIGAGTTHHRAGSSAHAVKAMDGSARSVARARRAVGRAAPRDRRSRRR